MNKIEGVGFAFFVREAQFKTAKEVLRDIPGVEVEPVSQPVLKRSLSEKGVIHEQKGFYIDGLCPENRTVILPCLLMENEITQEARDVNFWKRPNLSEIFPDKQRTT